MFHCKIGDHIEGPFTFFAPTNDAFQSLPADSLARLVTTPDMMKHVLLNHLVNGPFFLNERLDWEDHALPTLGGASHKIKISRLCNVEFSINVSETNWRIISVIFLFHFQLFGWMAFLLSPAPTILWRRTVSSTPSLTFCFTTNR